VDARRVAVVTGSSKGWGRLIAEALAADGVAVVVNGRSDDVDAVTTSIRGRGGVASAFRAAVDTPDGVDALTAHTLETFGRVDIWVNSLGVFEHQPLLRLELAHWEAVLRVQLTALFLGTQAAAREMVWRGDGGRIINVVGSAAYGMPCLGAHAASKGGALAATYSWAAELAPHGITVNAIRGTVQSPSMRGHLDRIGVLDAAADADDETWRRLGFQTPEEAAPLAVWLASESAGDVSGFHLGIDGPRVTIYNRLPRTEELLASSSWSVDELDRRLRPLLSEGELAPLVDWQLRALDLT
jgi:3-oxoacyl-[acyl-carrier protein] reductase